MINKKMSTLLSVCLLLSFVLIPTIGSAQGNSLRDGNYYVTLNEFEALKEMYNKLNGSSKNSLALEQTKNLTAEDKYIINNYEEVFKKHINTLNELDNSQLRNLNYNDSQIYAIRNFDGSEELMRQASATVSMDIEITSFTKTTNKTTAKVRTEFVWNGRSTGFGSDIVALTWSGPYYESNATASLTYRENEGLGSPTRTRSATVEPEGVYGSSVKIPKHIKVVNPNDYHIAKGTINQTLMSNSYETNCIVYTEYGFNTIGLTPSVNIPIGLSISFSLGVETIAKDRDNV